MKNGLLLLAIIWQAFQLTAQNTPPQITIQQVSVDETAKTVTVVYDLVDAENDNCEVWMKFSSAWTEYFALIDTADLSGDIGPAITPGNSRTIMWQYDSLTGTIFNTRIKVYASDGQLFDLQNMVEQVDSVKLLEYLQFIEGVRNYSTAPAHLNAVRDSIEDIFTRHGLVTQKHNFPYSTTQGINITGRKAGMKDESATYIICGHYDGVPGSPAADDNGSAVAGVFEILRILSQYDFEHTITFIGWDLEEYGLLGSKYHVQNEIKPYEDIRGVLNFEMIGYYDDTPYSQTLPSGFNLLFPQQTQTIQNDSSRGNFLIVCGNTTSNSLITEYANATAQYVPGLKFITLEVPGNGQSVPDLRRSDHAPFWDAGKKALMLTDGADTRNFNYHTPGDSIGTLNFSFMAMNVKATLATLATLASPISAGHDFFDLSLLSVPGNLNFAAEALHIYPNPAADYAMVQIYNDKPAPNILEIYDIAGRKVSAETVELPGGVSKIKVDISGLVKGDYFIVLRSGGSRVAGRLIRI